MTAQISDTFILDGNEYSLIGTRGWGLASPEQFGMKPEMLHTACYRGFFATYEVTKEALYLRELTLREKNGNYLPIDGIQPETGKYQATYRGLNVVVPFTGKIKVAKGFIDDLYIHMGFQKASAFETVLDLTLENGKVVRIHDRSKEMEWRRGAFKERYESGNRQEAIQEAFSLDLNLE
jgi:hypothetical protein